MVKKVISISCCVFLFTLNASAQLEVKWTQAFEPQTGENIESDIDWREERLTEPWVVADDFTSDGRLITAVRWWGSYFDEEFEPDPEPVIEEAFVISFFEHGDVPGKLLGSYIAPIDVVRIEATNESGWTNENEPEEFVFEYEVNLNDSHLDHESDIAKTDGFHEAEGDSYWISIAAENGGVLGEDWQFEHNDDEMLEEHFWGWHTWPDRNLNQALMGDLDMAEETWDYNTWMQFERQHEEVSDMAFELLTPAPIVLLGDCNGDGVIDLADLSCACGPPDVVDEVLNAIQGWAPGNGRGDFDGDGDIDFQDFLTLSGNFGMPGDYTDGDTDCNGNVAFADFLKFSSNFGRVPPPPVSSVPEPSSDCVFLVAGIACILIRRTVR